MHVLVIGAGIIGVTTAYELAQDGHSVTVVDRNAGPGLETSFANGGQISASHTDPWASPENLKRVICWLGKADAPLRLNPGWDMAALRWCAMYLRNCTRSRARVNTERMLRVALYSRERYAHLRQQLPIQYDLQQSGILHIFRNPGSYRLAKQQAAIIRDLGCDRQDITLDHCMELEPALSAIRQDLCGAIYCADDESGDAYKFCTALARSCSALGVDFKFNFDVTGLIKRNDRVTGVATATSRIEADAVVVAAGSFSPHLMRDLGMTIPVYPAKGYSLTLPVEPTDTAPTVSLIDDEQKLVYSRLGDTLRVAGMAELSGYDTKIDHQRAASLVREALRLFPTLNVPPAPRYWCGLRPQTPDSVPILGACGFENMFLNTGHGTLGWTMAAGSARITADLVSGKTPAIDMDGLTIARY